MKDFFDVTVLALLQGVAEFLPISSSGHLVIVQSILDVPEALRMRLEVFLHAGTLLSVFVFYARTIGGTCRGLVKGESAAWAFAAKLILSALPAVAVYFPFHDAIDALVTNPHMVGALLMFTGAVLLGTRYIPQGQGSVTPLRALLMGIGQALALLPGVSRSGLTLAVARAGRISPRSAAEFSFLMSAPLILGGVLLEFVKGSVSTGGMPWPVLAWGTALAAVSGYFSLVVLLKILNGSRFWLFGPYCLVVGLLTILKF